MRKPLLTDQQWKRIAPLLPQPPRRRHRGRPPKDNRAVFSAILWVLKEGARWQALPKEFGVSPTTAWRRLKHWEEQGVWLRAWRALLCELDTQERLDWEQCFIDGSFAPAKKGARALAKPSAARVRSGWWWSTARVFLWESESSKPARPK